MNILGYRKHAECLYRNKIVLLQGTSQEEKDNILLVYVPLWVFRPAEDGIKPHIPAFYIYVWRAYVLHGVRMWKSHTKSNLSGQTETDFQKCDLNFKPHMNVACNRFVNIGFHVIYFAVPTL